MTAFRQFTSEMVAYFTLSISSFIIYVAGSSIFISKYEPLVIQRKFEHIHNLKNTVKPTMMPNPRGLFAVNNDKMYVDFWAQGRHFQLVMNRGSPVFHEDAHEFESIDYTTAGIEFLSSDNLNFFTGYLNDNPRFEAFGYISGTKSGEETLVFTINLGLDSLHVENSGYIVKGDNWFNTIAYLRRDISEKQAQNPTFRSRRLLADSKPEVVDYYNKVEQFNYSIWYDRPLKPVSKVCCVLMVSDHRVFNYFEFDKPLVNSFHWFANTMAHFAYRRHDFDMDGISDNFSFCKAKGLVIRGPVSAWKQIRDLLKNDDNDSSKWLEGFAAANRQIAGLDKCSVVAFTKENMKGANGASSDALCCDAGTSMVVNFERLLSPTNVALEFTHQLARLIGARNDPDKCTAKANKNIKLGKYLSDASLFGLENVNNLRVSPCAMQDIHKTINDIYNRTCLFEPYIHTDTCGNAIRDSINETCDCGDRNECEIIDKCCVPVAVYNMTACIIDNITLHERMDGGKIVNYTYECSFRESKECCSQECLIVKVEDKVLCRPLKACYHPVYCDGTLVCPSNETKMEDGSSCEGKNKICINGSCRVDVCDYMGLESCVCKDFNNSCITCCVLKNGSSTECLPSPSFAKDLKIDRQNAFYRKDGFECGIHSVCKGGKCEIEERTDDSSDTPADYIDIECDWYCIYWYILLILTIILMILILLATLFYKKRYKTRKLINFNNHVAAAQGKLARNAKLRNAPQAAKVKASRLLALFPTVPPAVVVKTATGPGTEEEMVLKMLEDKHPMRRITG